MITDITEEGITEESPVSRTDSAAVSVEGHSGSGSRESSEGGYTLDDGFVLEDTSSYDVPVIRRQRPTFIKCRGIDKYLEGCLIGQGTFGEVKEVLDINTLTRRAVKVLHLKQMTKKTGKHKVRLALEEIRLLQRLRHKNIVQIVDVFYNEEGQPIEEEEEEDGLNDEDDGDEEGKGKGKYLFHNEAKRAANKKEKVMGMVWVVMEYCAASLGELLADAPENKLPLWQVRHYFVQIVEGIEYLHSQAIVHKDIKPDNMLLNNDQCLKIIDLNTADQLYIFSQSDACQSDSGSPYFQAPEILDINVDHFSGFKSDVWACGVTLFKMTTGIYPFTAETRQKFDAAVISGQFVVSPEMSASPGLHRLIQGMFRKDPKKRLSLDGVKRDIWFQTQPEVTCEPVPIPSRGQHGDKYRSMTMTPFLHEWHYPLRAEERTAIVVGEEAFDTEMLRQKIPMVRSNRHSPLRRHRVLDSFQQNQRSHQLLGIFGFRHLVDEPFDRHEDSL